MKIVLNNIDDISLSSINIHKNIITYQLSNIKLNGLSFKYKKNMIQNGDRYIVNFGSCDKIKQLNEYFKKNHRPFLKDNGSLYIEVIRNKITESIFKDKGDLLCICFKSINDNKYPKIHILPWTYPTSPT